MVVVACTEAVAAPVVAFQAEDSAAERRFVAEVPITVEASEADIVLDSVALADFADATVTTEASTIPGSMADYGVRSGRTTITAIPDMDTLTMATLTMAILRTRRPRCPSQVPAS